MPLSQMERSESKATYSGDQISTRQQCGFVSTSIPMQDIPYSSRAGYNFYSGKLSYTIIYRGVGRIYGLDLGAAHVNPDGAPIGETHKNYWSPGHRDKRAFVPEDISHPWSDPVGVWAQFCAEARLEHHGIMHLPQFQREMML